MIAFEANGRRYVHDGTPVVVICVDGSEPAYHQAAIRAGCMPWLAGVLAGGGTYRTARCAMPALTNPNNVSIATGCPPSVHGISGNTVLDPRTGDEVAMNDPAWLRVPTIFAHARRAGLEVQVFTAKNKLRRLLGEGLEPDRCLSAETADEQLCAEVGMARPDVYSAELSRFVLAAGVRFMNDERPDLMYLSLSDYVQHKHAPGTDEANRFYAMLDKYAAALDASGAVVVITADHGMSAKSHDDGSPRILYLHDHLPTGCRVVLPITDPYVAHHGALGSIAYVHVPVGLDAGRVVRAARRLDGVDAAYTRVDAARELNLPDDRIGDVVVLAEADTALGRDEAAHDLSGLEAPLRSHGAFAEQAIPFVVNRVMPDPGPVHNYDAFVVGCTVASTVASRHHPRLAEQR